MLIKSLLSAISLLTASMPPEVAALLYRLKGGGDAGFIETSNDGGKTWYFVCNDSSNFNNNAVQIVCKNMNYTAGTGLAASAVPRATYSDVTTPQFMYDDIECSGGETDILQCPKCNSNGAKWCTSGLTKAAAVSCTPPRSTATRSATRMVPTTTTTTTTTNTGVSTCPPVKPQDLIEGFVTSNAKQTSPPFAITDDLLRECHDFAATQPTPPVFDNEARKIQVQFRIESLFGIDTAEQTIRVRGSLVLGWLVNTCLKTAPIPQRDYEVVHITDPSQIWRPDVRFVSASDADVYMKSQDNFAKDYGMLIHKPSVQTCPNHTYHFIWAINGTFNSLCNLELANFPFDRQTCNFNFTLQKSVDLIVFDHYYSKFLWAEKAETNSWRHESHRVAFFNEYFLYALLDKAMFSVTLRRIPDYYVTNLMVPTLIMTMLDLGTFLIPPEYPDRAAFTVTIVLALAVTQSDVMSNVPKTANTVLLSDYVRFSTWICAGCTVYHLFALIIFNSAFGKREMCRKRITVARIVDICAFLLALGTCAAVHAYIIATADI